jgi:hypothetical protein
MCSKYYIWSVHVLIYLWEFSWNFLNFSSIFRAFQTISRFFGIVFALKINSGKILSYLTGPSPKAWPISPPPAAGPAAGPHEAHLAKPVMARTACRRLDVRVMHATDCVLAPYIARVLSPCALDAATLHHLLACIVPPALAASTGRHRFDGMEFRWRKPPPSRASQGRAAHKELLPFVGHQPEHRRPLQIEPHTSLVNIQILHKQQPQ